MKRLLSAIFGASLCITGALRAQQPGGGAANIAGTLYASNFAKWTAASGTNGPFSWSSPQVCTAANVGGVTFQPFKVGTPIQIVDTATPANSEIVTPSAVNINGSGCSLTATTTKSHYSFYLGSATAGLQEAINYANGQPYVVVITSDFTRLGGTTDMIVNAKGNSAVSILDERSSVIVPYVWSAGSSTYVAQPFGGSAPTGPQYRISGFTGSGSGGSFNLGQTNAYTDATGNPLTVPGFLAGKITNGALNGDLYATGSGNNGFSNALVSSDCFNNPAGCLLTRSQTSTDTENIPSLVHSRGGEYKHSVDSKYGMFSQLFYNAGNNDAGSNGFRWPSQSTYFWNDSNVVPNARMEADYFSFIGDTSGLLTGVPFTETLSHSHLTNMWAYTRGIAQAYSGSLNCRKVGDCMFNEDYLNYRAGAVAASDEGVKGSQYLLQEQAAPYGTITLGGANATLVNSTFTNSGNQADGLNLISTSEVMDSFLITGIGTQSGNLPNYLTTSTTHTISSGIATTTAACGANVKRDSPVSTVCTVTINSGSFSVGKAYVGDPVNPEGVDVLAVGSGTLTLGLTYAHTAGVPIYQGGGAGGKLALGYGLSDPSSTHNFTTFDIVGSRTTTTYDYVVEAFNSQVAKIAIPIPALPTISFVSLTRSGNVVTGIISGASNSAAAYRNFTPPGGSSFAISGASPTDFNGTITAPVVTPGKIVWNQAGPDETSLSGSLNIVGYNNAVIYCGAQVVHVLGIGVDGFGGASVSGTNPLQLEANGCQWPVGQADVQPNHYQTQVVGRMTVASGTTPPLINPNVGFQQTLSGPAWGGSIEFRSSTSDQVSSYVGFGGTFAPRTLFDADAFYGTIFNINTPPLNGGAVFNFGCPAEGCNANAYDYSLFILPGSSYISTITFSPSKNRVAFGSGLTATSDVTSGSAIGASILFAGAPGETPGVPGMGGYFTGVGQPGANNNTLCMGLGILGDCSGTLGAQTLIAPTLIAGLTPPTSMTVIPRGTTGSTTYTYACTAVGPSGAETNAATNTFNTGNATLSGTNYNDVNCPGVPGAASIKVYRTVGGATQGLIASRTNQVASNPATVHISDTGLTGDGTTPPTTNTTGKIILKSAADGCATFASGALGSTGIPCGSGGGGNTTSTALTTNTFTIGTGPNAIGNGPLSTDGTNVTSTEPILAPSFKLTGTVPSSFSLPAGTGNIPTLPANSGGFAGPVTGGTSYLIKLPATISAGIPHLATPAVGDNVNESAMTVGLVANADLVNASTTVNGVTCTLGSTCTVSASGIANIQITLPTTAIASNTCTTAATATMTGLATTSTFTTAFATDASAVVGWGTTGGLVMDMWPTANTLNWKVCNQTASSITPGAMTLNVGAR